MILKGRLAELMVQILPNLYRKYISVDRKGTAILYVKTESHLWASQECPTFLQEACCQPGEHWVQVESL
jgi:hypothetical protein